MSTKDDNKLIEEIKQDLKELLNGKSETTTQTKTNNLNYLIDPTSNKVNRLFYLSFENEDDRFSLSKYYTSKVEIKQFQRIN